MTRVLVTGGAGFVGVPLVAELLRRGHEVAVLDDFSVGARERLAPLTGAQVFEADLRDRSAVVSAVEQAGPTAIVHLAARHFIPWCEANPEQTDAINVQGTRELLEATQTTGVRAILLASTADLYQPGMHPHSEADRLAPPSVYGRSKLAAERLLSEHAQHHPQTTTRALRLFNVYGPGETNPHVLPAILAQLHSGDTLALGNTEARRDWLFVDDAVRAITDLLELAEGDGPVNIAGGRPASVDELVEALRSITGRDLRVRRDPARMRPSDRPVLVAGLSRLRELLPRFSPTPLEDGLRATLAAEGLV